MHISLLPITASNVLNKIKMSYLCIAYAVRLLVDASMPNNVMSATVGSIFTGEVIQTFHLLVILRLIINFLFMQLIYLFIYLARMHIFAGAQHFLQFTCASIEDSDQPLLCLFVLRFYSPVNNGVISSAVSLPN